MTSIPLIVRHDHCSMTVPDVDDAVHFFVSVLGGEELYRREVPSGSDPDAMSRLFNAHPAAGFRLAKIRVGGLDLELFEYQAPDTAPTTARNCDPGGHHIGFLVYDIDWAADALAAVDGIRILGAVSQLPNGHPLAGRRWIYFLTPWGQQLELVDDRARR